MNPSQISILSTLALKKVEYGSLLKEIEKTNDELVCLQNTYEYMFNDGIFKEIVLSKKIQTVALFIVEKTKLIEKMESVKKTLAHLKEMKELMILEYNGLVCMYRVV